MSKKRKNHDDYFRYSSDSDDDVHYINGMSSSTSREQSYCHYRTGSSSSDKERRLNEINYESSFEIDSDVDTRKKFKIKTRKILRHKGETFLDNNRREKSLFMDGLNPCEAVFTPIPTKRRTQKAEPLQLKRGSISNRISKTEVSKYPGVRKGIIRRRIRDESFIQSRVLSDFPPCPGLEHVTEIRGLKRLIYFCDLCNASRGQNDILHHLSGFKHQLNCLKALRPDKLKRFEELPKRDSERYLLGILSYIQEKEGIGRILVEKEYLTKGNYEAERNDSSRGLGIPGTSTDYPGMTYEEITVPTSIAPNLSKYDYFCLVCECSVSDSKMFRSHTKSGRLPSSVRQYPRNRATKTISEYMPDVDAFLVDRVDDHDGPVVGLNYIREMQHVEDGKETYHCFLCGECLTCINIIHHTTSQSHRINYLVHINHHSVDLIRENKYNENRLYYIIEEICRKLQKDVGAGHPEVYIIKKSKEH